MVKGQLCKFAVVGDMVFVCSTVGGYVVSTMVCVCAVFVCSYGMGA